MPQSVTPKELEQLLNGLLQNEERLPYGFYIDTQELAGSLGAHLHEHEVGATETSSSVLMKILTQQWLLLGSHCPPICMSMRWAICSCCPLGRCI